MFIKYIKDVMRYKNCENRKYNNFQKTVRQLVKTKKRYPQQKVLIKGNMEN